VGEALAYEASLFAIAVASGEAQEGTQAFLDKRKAVWAQPGQ
jgi:enoyl-CoA hydratase/carnithine racemase